MRPPLTLNYQDIPFVTTWLNGKRRQDTRAGARRTGMIFCKSCTPIGKTMPDPPCRSRQPMKCKQPFVARWATFFLLPTANIKLSFFLPTKIFILKGNKGKGNTGCKRNRSPRQKEMRKQSPRSRERATTQRRSRPAKKPRTPAANTSREHQSRTPAPQRLRRRNTHEKDLLHRHRHRPPPRSGLR